MGPRLDAVWVGEQRHGALLARCSRTGDCLKYSAGAGGAMRDLHRLLAALDQGQLDKIVLTQRNQMRAVLVTLERYRELERTPRRHGRQDLGWRSKPDVTALRP